MENIRTVPPLPKRKLDAHKGDLGRVLVIAGSVGMAGAACLCTDAVLRSGAGIAVLGTPRSIYAVLATKITCGMVRPLPDTKDGTLSTAAQSAIFELADKADVLAVGPGLSRHPDTSKLILSTIFRVAKPVVCDADALNIISQDIPVLKNITQPIVLTPHPGEMARLAKKTIAEVQSDREGIAFDFAKRHKITLVLKGAGTVVTDGNALYKNNTGNPGMATAGSGDILTGVIAGLIAQQMSPLDASVLGVYAHGLAGDIAAEKVGQVSLIATDILDSLPAAFKRVAAENPS
ncbi:MAG: NAD(P)H-hydrate dehydratase [Planctomycetota bacterium]|nr:NAD(P)H-hydrate dehydratase [Planctomycetota bacterium]